MRPSPNPCPTHCSFGHIPREGPSSGLIPVCKLGEEGWQWACLGSAWRPHGPHWLQAGDCGGAGLGALFRPFPGKPWPAGNRCLCLRVKVAMLATFSSLGCEGTGRPCITPRPSEDCQPWVAKAGAGSDPCLVRTARLRDPCLLRDVPQCCPTDRAAPATSEWGRQPWTEALEQTGQG